MMGGRNDDAVHLEYAERLLAMLEQSLRRNGQLLPVEPEQFSVEGVARERALEEELPGGVVPPWYDDPFAALEAGRRVIANPPMLQLNIASAFPSVVGALATAARNGHQITPEVRARMNADRRESEST